MSVIFPVFLTGAMAVQVRESLGLTESDFGFAIGAFFAGSAGGSMMLGRLAERLGPRRAIRAGLTVTVAADLAIAVVATGSTSLILILFAAGLGNALTQPAINLLLVRVVDRSKLGLAMALKQSGMPGAAMFGGLAVPAVALTVGWRAAYVMAAALALIAVALSGVGDRSPTGDRGTATDSDPGSEGPPGTTLGRRAGDQPGDGSVPRADLGVAVLALMAAVGVLGGGAANVLVGYLVSGAVEAGMAPGSAGLLLTLGSGLGIASRLFHGWLADHRPIDVLARVVLLFVLGAIGTTALALHTPSAYLLATPLAFAAGWAWPGLFNLMVVNANRSAPAAATGFTQTGVYLGSLSSPVAAGVVIERSGYAVTWLLTGGALAGAAILALMVRVAMSGTSTIAGSEVESATPTG